MLLLAVTVTANGDGALSLGEKSGQDGYAGGSAIQVTRAPTDSATCESGAVSPATWQTSGSPPAGAGLNAASLTHPMAIILSWHDPMEA